MDGISGNRGIGESGNMGYDMLGGEAQGGATYCALASLALMGRLDVLMPAQRAALEHWCLQR